MGTSGVSSATTSTAGTNVPPVSFPGIASGIDYTSIINQLTSLTLAPVSQLNAQIATLNSANAELVKINGLIYSVQASLDELSDPNLFESYSAVSGDGAVATAASVAGESATPGVYVIDSTQVATSTQIVGSLGVQHSMLDTLASGPYAGQASDAVPLAASFAAISPSNGTSGQGKVTIDGVTVSYDVNSQSIDTIFANINSALHAAGDTSFNIGFSSGDTVQMTDDNSITLGSAADQGNLLSVLKLDQAPIVNGGSSYSVTGTSGVGGINEAEDFNATTSAGFTTPVTAGTFTINGVKLAVSADQNLADVVAEINQSSAGVTASFDMSTNQITLTNVATGPQSIVLGSSSDTSNFLSAAGLTPAAGGVSTAGRQAVVVLETPSGGTRTVYSNSNAVTNAIPGIDLKLQSNDPSTPFSVTVSQNNAPLISALTTFVSAYNTAMNEINVATAPPVVISAQNGSQGSSASVGGGVLYGRVDVSTLQNELTQLVSGFLGSGSSGYNSLSQIGLSVDSSFSTLTSNSNAGSDGQSAGSSTSTPGQGTSLVQSTTYQGTDGQLQALDVAALTTALQANPNAVQDLLQGAKGLTTQLGTYLTGVTGDPTILNSGIAGVQPSTSLLQGWENQVTSQVTSLQAQVSQIQDSANMQADLLRSEFTSSESAIAGYQALQQEVDAEFGVSSSSSSSSGS